MSLWSSSTQNTAYFDSLPEVIQDDLIAAREAIPSGATELGAQMAFLFGDTIHDEWVSLRGIHTALGMEIPGREKFHMSLPEIASNLVIGERLKLVDVSIRLPIGEYYSQLVDKPEQSGARLLLRLLTDVSDESDAEEMTTGQRSWSERLDRPIVLTRVAPGATLGKVPRRFGHTIRQYLP